MSTDTRKLAAACKAAGLGELQTKAAAILLSVNGLACALAFVRDLAKKEERK